jgi:hypothetical protein
MGPPGEVLRLGFASLLPPESKKAVFAVPRIDPGVRAAANGAKS